MELESPEQIVAKAAIAAAWENLSSLYSRWNDPSNDLPGMRKMIAEEYLRGIRQINKLHGYADGVHDFERVHGALEGSEKYLRSPGSGILGTVREKLGDAARVVRDQYGNVSRVVRDQYGNLVQGAGPTGVLAARAIPIIPAIGAGVVAGAAIQSSANSLQNDMSEGIATGAIQTDPAAAANVPGAFGYWQPDMHNAAPVRDAIARPEVAKNFYRFDAANQSNDVWPSYGPSLAGDLPAYERFGSDYKPFDTTNASPYQGNMITSIEAGPPAPGSGVRLFTIKYANGQTRITHDHNDPDVVRIVPPEARALPEVPPPPSDNQLPAYNIPAGMPGGNLATKIVSASYTAMPGSDMPIVKINYANGSSKAVPTSDPELRAYEDSLPNSGAGITGSVTSALSSMASAVAGAFGPGRSTTVIVTPDGKVQPAAAAPAAAPAPAPMNPLVAAALKLPGVPPAMSDTDMYGAPAPGATDTQLASAKLARDATIAAGNAPITPEEQAKYRGDQEALFVKTMEARWKAGLDGLGAAGLGAKAAELGLARNAMATRRASALATLGYLRPALQQAISRLSGQKAPSAAEGSAEYQLWMQQQDPQALSQYLATVEAYGKAQSAYDTATETYIAATLTPELLLSKPGEWSNIREVDHPSFPGAKVLGGIYTDGAGRQSFRYLGWDDNAGALTQAPAPADTAPADAASGKRGGGGEAPVIIPGSGAGLAGISTAAGATPQPPAPVPPAAPGGAGPRLVTVGAKPPAAPAAVRERAYESKDDPLTGFRHTWDDAGNLVKSTPIPGWDVKNTYKHDKRVREDGAIVDLVTDLQGNVIEERVLTAPDPQKVEAANEARLTGAAQRVALGNNQLLQQSTLDQGAWAAERTQANEAYDNKRKDLEGKIKASSEARKRQVLDLVAQKKLTLPQALSILHDQQGLATAMATEQQKWEQQRAQRMAEKDKGLTYAQSLDKDIGFGNALLSLRSDPQAEDIKRRYAADISTLPGNADQSVGVRLAQQRGYSGVAYEDPGVWQQPNVDVTPEALASMGVGADPTDEFYAAYMALEQPVMKPRPALPTLMPMPTGAPAAQVAPLPAAVSGWGAGLGRFGQ